MDSFTFVMTKPFSDWYTTDKVVIKKEDYYYFKLELRFGRSWWLIGSNPKEEPEHHWKDTQIGELSENDLKRFIEWAKTERGSKIIKISSISGSFDIISEINKLTNTQSPC